jgi:DNA replication protein DnaC
MDDLSLASVCPLCEGSGLKIVERPDGSRVARDCQCRVERRAARMIARTRVPKRYEHCSLDSFETDFPGATHSIQKALITAREFVKCYPLETNGTGLLLTGGPGRGKTHLAVGILQALVQERSANGLFCHYGDLLKQIQNTYNRQVQATELEVLAPIFDAEVLVLDELGASRPSDWVWDTVAHILNTRYNDQRTTIITTNFPNAAPLEGPSKDDGRLAREESLGDRIGERMRSRLQEMCVVVEMKGVDFRQTVNLARFG